MRARSLTVGEGIHRSGKGAGKDKPYGVELESKVSI